MPAHTREDVMSAHATQAPNTLCAAGHPARARGPLRPVLVGADAFGQLKRLQALLPQPRLDMRYLVEGFVELLHQQPNEQQRWLAAARAELLRVLGATASGTGEEHLAEGTKAQAVVRAHGAQAADARAQPGCKSLLIGLQAFRRLKAIQDITHHPRLELRYLIDGAIALLDQEQDLHTKWVQHSRQALLAHLSLLQEQSLQSSLEIKT